MKLTEHLQNKKILFITTREPDYIRNVQEIRLAQGLSNQYTILASSAENYFLRILSVYLQLLFTNPRNYDVVFVGFVPQLILPLFRHKFRHNFVIIDFFISMYDTLCFDRKKFTPNSLIGRWIRQVDRRCLACAGHIVCDTNAHGKYFVTELGADPNKLETLYLEADTHIYHPMEIARPQHLSDKFIVLYFGSILPLQGVDVILNAIDHIKDTPGLYFYIIGPVDSRKHAFHKPQAENIKYIPWLEQEKLAKYIAMSDLCLAGHFNADIEKAGRTIPGKAYIYHAMKKSMILGENSANHELFNDELSIYVPMGDSEALADVILSYQTAFRS